MGLFLMGCFPLDFQDGLSGSHRSTHIASDLVSQGLASLRKILVSVKFVSAILGPEMAAPILRTRGKIAFFLQENPLSIKFLVLGGGYFGFGGGECRFYFYGREDFSASQANPQRESESQAFRIARS